MLLKGVTQGCRVLYRCWYNKNLCTQHLYSAEQMLLVANPDMICVRPSGHSCTAQ